METFAEVIVPLALKGTLTYRVPEEMAGRLEPGMRVTVPLGKSKHYTGMVREIHERAPQDFTPKVLEGLGRV